MAYVAVDKDGIEKVFSQLPERCSCEWGKEPYMWFVDDDFVPLPQGMIKKMIGRTLTWDDEPVELEEQTTGDDFPWLQAQKIEAERLLNLAKGHPLMESSLQGMIDEIKQRLKEK